MANGEEAVEDGGGGGGTPVTPAKPAVPVTEATAAESAVGTTEFDLMSFETPAPLSRGDGGDRGLESAAATPGPFATPASRTTGPAAVEVAELRAAIANRDQRLAEATAHILHLEGERDEQERELADALRRIATVQEAHSSLTDRYGVRFGGQPSLRGRAWLTGSARGLAEAARLATGTDTCVPR